MAVKWSGAQISWRNWEVALNCPLHTTCIARESKEISGYKVSDFNLILQCNKLLNYLFLLPGMEGGSSKKVFFTYMAYGAVVYIVWIKDYFGLWRLKIAML